MRKIVSYIKKSIKSYFMLKKIIKKLNVDIADIEDSRFIIKSKVIRINYAKFTCMDTLTGEKYEFYEDYTGFEMRGGWIFSNRIFDNINNFIIKRRNFKK